MVKQMTTTEIIALGYVIVPKGADTYAVASEDFTKAKITQAAYKYVNGVYKRFFNAAKLTAILKTDFNAETRATRNWN